MFYNEVSEKALRIDFNKEFQNEVARITKDFLKDVVLWLGYIPIGRMRFRI